MTAKTISVISASLFLIASLLSMYQAIKQQ